MILTITDHDCSKAIILIPCKESIMAEGVAALIMRHVFSRFGAPKKFISDRDKVHIQGRKGILLQVQNSAEHVYGISPKDRRTSRKNQPRSRNIPPHVLRQVAK